MIDEYIEQYEDMQFKDLSLIDANTLLKRFENELEYWENERTIAFEQTQPRAVAFDKEIVKGGKRSNAFDNYVINVAKIDRKISVIRRRINNLMKYIEKELKIMNEYDPVIKQITYYREEAKEWGKRLTWEQISYKVHYSVRQCKRLYYNSKK